MKLVGNKPSILALELIPVEQKIYYSDKFLLLQKLVGINWYTDNLLPLKYWSDVDKYLIDYFTNDKSTKEFV